MANKVFTYAIFIAVTMILFNLAGLTTSTGFILSALGMNIGNIQNFGSTALYVAIIAGITSLVFVTGIRVGWFSAPTTTTFASAIIGLLLVVLMADLISMIRLAATPTITWVSYIIFLIIAPLIIGFAIAIFDWVRGDY